MSGTLYGIGIGPGDPELITLKGLRFLRACPVLAYPAPEHGESLARKIVDGHLPGAQEEIVIRMPMVETRFPAQEVYDWAARELGVRLDAGRDIAVLCEGDPFFYGSFMYLFARMAEHYPVEVIPGVSSLMACATRCGAPLAARNDVLVVLPATLSEEDLAKRMANADAVAVIKIGRHLDKVRRVIETLGLADRARYVEHATMEDEAIFRLEDMQIVRAPYFSMILVHSRGEAWHV